MPTKIILPDTTATPLDETTLSALLYDALVAGLRDFKCVDVTGNSRVVSQVQDHGSGSVRLPAPYYRKPEVWSALPRVATSVESNALTEYLWAHGALKKTLTRDDDQVPSKESWQQFVWAELIFSPLLSLLEDNAVDQLSRTSQYTPWFLSQTALNDAAAEVARNVVSAKRFVRAMCPTVGLEIIEHSLFTAETGTEVHSWSPEDRCAFVSVNERHYLDDDMSTWAGHCLIQFEALVDDLSDDAAGTAIVRKLDSLKWAIMVATGAQQPFEEGPVVLRSPRGSHARTLRRGDTLARTRSLPSVQLTPVVAKEVQSLLSRLRCTSKLTRELDGALWLFGRSCNAQLARDIVLDSVIGLEMLLVPTPGESTYRFRLHGAVLIEGESPETLDDELKTLYVLRSNAAHGAPGENAKFATVASRARFLLAKAIHSVINKSENGELDLVAAKGDIGKAVERLVRVRATGGR